jgi:hypothetical protein
MSTTTNLADFGYREFDMAADLLKAFANGKGPSNFDLDGVTLMMNQNSGNVFLTNSEYQVLMMNGDDLEIWHFTPYNGHEGFAEELKADYEANPDNWHEDDIQYLIDYGIIDDPAEREEVKNEEH